MVSGLLGHERSPRFSPARMIRPGLFVLSLVLILTFPVLASGVAVRPLPPLEDLESMAGSGPEVLAALAELDRDSSLRVRQERISGPKAFAGLTYGAYDEPASETAEDRISYQKLSGRAGVSFPILGTWSREKIAVLQADIRVLEGRQRSEELRSRNLTALRKAYSVLWVEERRTRMLDDFLSVEEEADGILRERADKGFLLEADRLDFMAAFDLARQERAAARLRCARALKTLSLVTGQVWRREGPVPLPRVPAGEARNRLEETLEQSTLPELRHREGVARFQEKIYAETRDVDLEGNVDVGLTWGTDFPGSTGTGVYVGVSVKEPFGTIRARDDKAREAAASELERVRSENLLARLEARGELMESLALHQYGMASLATAEAQMEASCESLRENRLRHEKLPGDTYEKLLQSRNRYMKDALALFDAEALVLQTEMELLRFAYPYPGQAACDPRAMPLPDEAVRSRLLDSSWLVVEGGLHSSLRVPSPAPLDGPEGRTAYVWWADPFLSPGRRAGEFERFRASGFSRMLLSFTAGEVRYLRSPAGRTALRDLLAEAEERGIIVDLLLGDPAWILPSHRAELLELVSFFERFPFRGIHLDLEPDSLPESAGRRAELLEETFRTVRAVGLRTARPLSLSVHPRYLEGALGEVGGPGLERLGLEEVAVMIYSTDPERVVGRFRSILDAWPTIRLGLAQSVEKVLPKAQSYAFLGRKAFESRMDALKGALDCGAFAGLLVQSWKDYREMNP